MEDGQDLTVQGCAWAAPKALRGSPFLHTVAGISLGPEVIAPLSLQHKWTGFWFLSPKGPRGPT